MATTTFKPSASSNCFPQSKRRLLLILFIAAASIFAGICITRAYQKFTSLHQDMMQAQILVSQYKDSLNNKGNNMRLLEQNSETNKFKTQQLEERIQVLEQALRQQQRSSNSDGKEAMKKELEAYKLQFQQKIQGYEQQILALTQQIKNYREENQITREQQMKMRNEYQQLLNKISQNSQVGSSHDDLENVLESRLTEFVNTDYEHEQKFKDLQRAIENCAKVGELKALEVYYDDKIDSLSNVIKNNKQKPSSSSAGQERTVQENPQQLQQLKQEILKLNMEKEDMRNVINSLLTQQRKNEERLKKVEAQGNQNTNTKNQPTVEQTESSRKPQPMKKEAPKEAAGRGSEEVVQNMKRRLSEMNEQQKVNSGGCNSCSGQRDQRRQNNHGFGFDHDAWMRQHMNLGHRNLFSHFPGQRQMNNCMFC